MGILLTAGIAWGVYELHEWYKELKDAKETPATEEKEDAAFASGLVCALLCGAEMGEIFEV